MCCTLRKPPHAGFYFFIIFYFCLAPAGLMCSKRSDVTLVFQPRSDTEGFAEAEEEEAREEEHVASDPVETVPLHSN